MRARACARRTLRACARIQRMTPERDARAPQTDAHTYTDPHELQRNRSYHCARHAARMVRQTELSTLNRSTAAAQTAHAVYATSSHPRIPHRNRICAHRVTRILYRHTERSAVNRNKLQRKRMRTRMSVRKTADACMSSRARAHLARTHRAYLIIDAKPHIRKRISGAIRRSDAYPFYCIRAHAHLAHTDCIRIRQLWSTGLGA